MSKPKRGRHAPAFVLLMIATEPTHGLGILSKMDEHVPFHRMDTAVIYRTLKDFEANGLITSNWADSAAGPKKKIYTITDKGMKKLEEYREDIDKSLNNLQMFIKLHQSL